MQMETTEKLEWLPQIRQNRLQEKKNMTGDKTNISNDTAVCPLGIDNNYEDTLN